MTIIIVFFDIETKTELIFKLFLGNCNSWSMAVTRPRQHGVVQTTRDGDKPFPL